MNAAGKVGVAIKIRARQNLPPKIEFMYTFQLFY